MPTSTFYKATSFQKGRRSKICEKCVNCVYFSQDKKLTFSKPRTENYCSLSKYERSLLSTACSSFTINYRNDSVLNPAVGMKILGNDLLGINDHMKNMVMNLQATPSKLLGAKFGDTFECHGKTFTWIARLPKIPDCSEVLLAICVEEDKVVTFEKFI